MREIQFREALREAMQEEMRTDSTVFLIGEEVAEYNGAYKVSQGMLDEFGPERVIDTPIAELGFGGISVGAAASGLRPIVEFMTFNFSLVAIDQVINSASKIMSMSGGQYSCPIVFRGPTGNAGQLSSQHSSNFENWFANTPGLKVVYPAFPYDAKGLLCQAFEDTNPVIFFEHKGLYRSISGQVPTDFYTVPFGKAQLIRTGSQFTIVTYGLGVHWAMDYLNEHPEQEADLIDLRTLLPLDMETIYASVKKTGRVVVLHEDSLTGGIGGEIAARIGEDCFEHLDAPVVRCASLDTPIPFNAELEKNFLANRYLGQSIDKLLRY